MGDARSAVRLRDFESCLQQRMFPFVCTLHPEFVELVFSSMDSFRDSLSSVLYVLMLLVKEPFLRFKTQLLYFYPATGEQGSKV
jgi:hypothetical protein